MLHTINPTKPVLLVCFLSLFQTSEVQAQLNYDNTTYYFGIGQQSIQASDFNDFHISDWESFGLGAREGRVLVPLSANQPSNQLTTLSFNVQTSPFDSLSYNYIDKLGVLLGIDLGFGKGITSIQVLLGLNYPLYEKSKLTIGIMPKVGYASGITNFGNIEVLPGKTPPVILPEGTFNEGDDIKIDMSSTTVQLGTILEYQFSSKVGLFLNPYFNLSLNHKNTLAANDVEIPLDSPAIVQTNGSSNPANIDPKVNLRGFGFATGITYKL